MSVSEELVLQSKRAWRQRAGVREDSISAFYCRCCLKAVYGIDVPARAIVELWLSCSSMVGADEDVLNAGIDLETHLAIAEAVLKQEGICESTLESRIYDSLDVSGKGFVTVEDLKRVLSSTGRARLASNRAEQLFAQLDDLNIGKISITQIKQKLRGGRASTIR
jgi:hypothetical protein